MPQFEMDQDGLVEGLEFADLPAFVQGYLEAMFFTNEATGVSMVDWSDPEVQSDLEEGSLDGPLPADAGFGDIYPDSLKTAIEECAAFEKEAADLLEQAYQRDYDAAQAGRDFWFTRCGHGVGYWDRDVLSSTGAKWSGGNDTDGESLGEKLSDIARTYGNRDASFGDAADGSESPTGYGWVFIE
jgi:hypothetical protein